MKITGTASLAAPPQQVWDAFHDPAVLARCLPGCNTLTEIGPNEYAMQITAGVAAIKGIYDGKVAIANQNHPESFTLKAAGAGAPGTVEADVVVLLAPADGGGTVLTYDADAAVGGPVGGVGQRMLTGVSRKMAGQFFQAVDAHLAGAPGPATTMAFPAAGSPSPAPAGAAAVSATTPGGIPSASVSTGVGTVYSGRPAALATGGASRMRDFALGALSGAGIAIAGVLVGWAIGRG
jgi:carbon monoxide dehydrogenase subunit G